MTESTPVTTVAAGIAADAAVSFAARRAVRTAVAQLPATERDKINPEGIFHRLAELVPEAHDPHIATALKDAGDEFARSDAALAASLYGAAVRAGTDPGLVAAARAETHARAADLSGALHYAEQALESANATTFADVAGIAATLLSHRGLSMTAAGLYRSVGVERAGTHAPLAALAMYVVGSPDEAARLLDVARKDTTPTLVTSGKLALVEGIELSLHNSRTAVMSKLANATALLEPAGGSVLLPNTPAAIGAIFAMHSGEFTTARAILDRAIRTDLGGPAFRARHRLLRAWVAMLTGQIATASRLREEARDGHALELRDEYLSHALEAGIARRSSDVSALQVAWQHARETVLEFQVDLLSLLPFGELMLAAARVREPFRLDVQLDEATSLLTRLGEPPMWSAMLHWQLLQAAILAETPDAMTPHVARLAECAGVSGFHSALADAGVVWQRTLAGDVDFAATSRAARQLDAHGLPWDASRLAAQAAARTTDRKIMVDLLQCARQLQPVMETPTPPPAPATSERGPAEPVDEPRGVEAQLSLREFEVARLVLAGQTYREIGERLFISSKTVEHHIARIRKRLGASNRSELFALMQAALDRSGRAHDSTVRWLNVAPGGSGAPRTTPADARASMTGVD